MATRKTSTKKAPAKRKTAAKKSAAPIAQLPKGYEALTAGFAPSWQYETEPLLEGVITGFSEVEVERGTGRNKRTETQRNCTVERADGTSVTVWESAMLRPIWEECEEGEQIAIAFQGMGVAKPGQNAPKLFAVGYK